MTSAVWSPSNRYVAINNHAGFAASIVCIVSLSDGKIRTSHGSSTRFDFDHLSEDSADFLKIAGCVESKLKALYPDIDNDTMTDRASTCVAYGWKDDNHVLIFSNYGFEKQSPGEEYIRVYTSLLVTEKLDYRASKFTARHAKDDDSKQYRVLVK